MSKLDELLDEISCGDWDDDHPLVLAARAELAALRRRAEDAEMIVRLHGDCRFRVWAIRDYTPERYGLPRLWKIRCLAHGLSDGITLKADHATGLPILTDEVRKALTEQR